MITDEDGENICWRLRSGIPGVSFRDHIDSKSLHLIGHVQDIIVTIEKLKFAG